MKILSSGLSPVLTVAGLLKKKNTNPTAAPAPTAPPTAGTPAPAGKGIMLG